MEFYNNNYKEFSKTRYSIWKSVQEFSKNINKDSYVLDAGHGNGKNMKYLSQFTKNIIGIDNCEKFVNKCADDGLKVKIGDVRHVDTKSNTFDFIICIAVVHHLKTKEERTLALKELIRVLKPGGKLLLTVWAFETDILEKRKFDKGDNIVLFNKEPRYYHIFDKLSFDDYCKINCSNKNIFWDKGNWNVIFTK